MIGDKPDPTPPPPAEEIEEAEQEDDEDDDGGAIDFSNDLMGGIMSAVWPHACKHIQFGLCKSHFFFAHFETRQQRFQP